MDLLSPDVVNLIVQHLDSARDRKAFICALARPWTARNVQDVAIAALDEHKMYLMRLVRHKSSRCIVHGCTNMRISFIAWLRPRVMTRGIYYCSTHIDQDLLESAELYATEDDRLEYWR